MRALKICLWVVGLACLLPGVVLFLPMSTYNSISQFFIDIELPKDPLFAYAVRIMATTYVPVGVFYIMLALKPHGYGLMLPFAGIAPVVLGIACMAVGIAEGLPFTIFGGDAVFALLMGGLILYFWRTEKTERPETGTKQEAQGDEAA